MLNISEHTVTPLSIRSPRELELGWKIQNEERCQNHSDLAPQGCISCSNECRAFPKASSADVTPRGPSQWKWSGLSASRGGLPNAGWDRLNLAGSIQSFGVATWKKNWKKWKNWTIDVRCPRKDHNHKVPSSCNKIKNMEKYETIIKD